MKRITLFTIILALLAPQQVRSKIGVKAVPFYIYNAASQFNIDSDLLYAVCKVESNCTSRAINPNDGTKEQKAAGIIDKSYGLFQIKKSTAEGLGFISKKVVYVDKVRRKKIVKVRTEIDLTSELLKPEVNAYYAAKLLRKLYNRYGNNTSKVISAYNAGHATKANIDYVNKVSKEFVKVKVDKRF